MKILRIATVALLMFSALPAAAQSAVTGEWIEIQRDGRTLRAWVAMPAGAEAAPAIIVIHANRGLDDWTRGVADRLAAEGYIAAAPDLLSVGRLANHVREQRHGDTAYFVCNTHINHTNVCVATCDFCAFAARPGDPRGYSMSLDAVFEKVAALPPMVREVHIVGGLHPDLPWTYFIDMMKGIKKLRSDLHIKAFTAVEIFFFQRLYRLSVERVIAELSVEEKDALSHRGKAFRALADRIRVGTPSTDGRRSS